ncbi:hypothetical protein [Leucobacter aridicollis]|uniref:Uncharacterized protein n=1 Tax=Leucobacter aridicollis TaxID=283878 RepID=A0A852R9Q5_9MICO|nr:hypothetical protein [Leucobacter aridicollis]MBL3682622.1 hypothetical protein [Leucobacter aridicollis]NYD26046.1 hypothetical protein [Leucobacter aridicollis]
MSDTFTASNGVRVTRRGESVKLSCERMANRLATFDDLNRQDMEALREFFQHERDKELGRWRDPERPDIVVYLCDAERCVRVLDELTGVSQLYVEGQMSEYRGDMADAARTYFAAHPEPRSWHDARDGQLWLIRFDDFPDTDVSALVKGGRFVYNDHCHEGTATLKDSSIVGGTQIWPEVKP